MKEIQFQENEGMLILSTPECDSCLYLSIEDKKAVTSNLDDNSCQKSFGCNAKELKEYINSKGY